MGVIVFMVFILTFLSLILFTVFKETIAAFLSLCIAFCLLGWIVAHGVIMKDCEKLGKFYVDNTVYECTTIKEEK